MTFWFWVWRWVFVLLGRKQFEKRYAKRSGVSVEFLHSWGRFAERCRCEEDHCEGWTMGHQWEDALVEVKVTQQEGK